MIIDMVNRIKNANSARKYKVNVIKSKITLEIADILKREGFIESFQHLNTDNDKYISIKLRYKGLQQLPYITKLMVISKPGLRVYVSKRNIPRILAGIGIAVCLICLPNLRVLYYCVDLFYYLYFYKFIGFSIYIFRFFMIRLYFFGQKFSNLFRFTNEYYRFCGISFL